MCGHRGDRMDDKEKVMTHEYTKTVPSIGSYTFYQNMLVFILADGTVIDPPEGTATVGDPSYSFPDSCGHAITFTLSEEFVTELQGKTAACT